MAARASSRSSGRRVTRRGTMTRPSMVSAYFAWLNRGKESTVLDLKDEADLALVRRMVAKADVFVQNLAPGAAARMGLDAQSLVREFRG